MGRKLARRVLTVSTTTIGRAASKRVAYFGGIAVPGGGSEKDKGRVLGYDRVGGFNDIEFHC